jgi:serine/threonine protein kinase
MEGACLTGPPDSPPNHRALPQVGSEFAGYLLDGVLGRGGMSVVFRASHPRLGSAVALKLLAAELTSDDTFRERFVREARAAAALTHPNIVPIFDAGERDGFLYIVMRYVDSDLRALLQREGPLEVRRGLHIVRQICGALQAAHRRGLIHRDIKPGNVLLQPPPEQGIFEHVYLADFGLTKHAESRSGITNTGQFVGTIDYVAPEQIQGRTIGPRADIYALGCLTYNVLTNEVPYPRSSDVAVLWAHMQDPFPHARSLQPELPEAVDDAIMRATAKDPDDRYSDALQFAAALEAAVTPDHARPEVTRGATRVAPQRQVAPPLRPAETASGPIRRTPTYEAPAEQPTPDGDDRRPRRRPSALVIALLVLAAGLAAALAAVLLTNDSGGSGSSNVASTSGSTGTGRGAAFPADTAYLQRVVSPSYLMNQYCRSLRPRPAGVVEAVSCERGGIKYQLQLYPSTVALNAAFNALLEQHGVSRSATKGACNPTGGSWDGYGGIWRHPESEGVRKVGGEQACYSLGGNGRAMAWTHQRDNGQGKPNIQPSHYNTMIIASENDPLPRRLVFWRKNIAATWGRSNDPTVQSLPPLPHAANASG